MQSSSWTDGKATVFDSYYWHDAHLDPEHESARAVVRGASVEAAVGAFRILLASSRVSAQGIALDQYHHAEANSRFGTDNPFREVRRQVLQTARAVLAAPPVHEGDDGASIGGANHASALGALLNLADAADAERLAAILEQRPNHVVLGLALQCAGTVLEKDASLVALAAAVRQVVQDSAVPARERGNALHLVELTEPELAEQLALELVRGSDLRLQADAAWLLAERDLGRHRDLLVEIEARWPESAPYPAFEVRQLLEE
jgi:hypothetical protein